MAKPGGEGSGPRRRPGASLAVAAAAGPSGGAQHQPCPSSPAEPRLGPGGELQLAAGRWVLPRPSSIPAAGRAPRSPHGGCKGNIPLWSHSLMSPWPGMLQRAAKFSQKFRSASLCTCTKGTAYAAIYWGVGFTGVTGI